VAMTPAEIREALAANKMRVRPKSESWLMRTIGFLLALFRINARFLERYTTVIWRDVWYPSPWRDFDIDDDAQLAAHASTFEHELVHVAQRKKWWLFWAVSYLLLPLPFGLAWFRWRWEREAYLTNIRNGRTIEQCVDALWAYGWPWPRAWMRAWFEAHADK